MKDHILKKLQDLSEEAQALVEHRERITRTLEEIDVRLHQVSGAISEIDSLLKSLEKDEVKTDEAGKNS